MNYAIRQPCHHTEEGTFVGGQYVAEIRTVEYVFERGKDADPYRRAPCAWDESDFQSY